MDVATGLGSPVKRISSKYFYDERGSQLFNQICELDEYYLTRTELQIMQRFAPEMAAELDARVRLIEYGSGSSIKTTLLLDHLENPVAYIPVDVSEEHVLEVSRDLARRYPHIDIIPVIGDFTVPFQLPESNVADSHDAVYFPGSTIGNFEHEAALEMLHQIAEMVQPGGGLLVGIDLHKDPAVIERAYNDAAGVTAEFNKNMLVRMNSELGADFDLEAFRHHSVYNLDQYRIESSLVSLRDQTVTIGGEQFHFEAGEHLHTEYSHKYTIDGFALFAADAGFRLNRFWTDDDQLFGVLHLVVD